MSHGSWWWKVAAVTAVLTGGAGVAHAQHSYDGNIMSLLVRATPSEGPDTAACHTAMVAFLHNDFPTNPNLVNPIFPGHDFRPSVGSIAYGMHDDVATITDFRVDDCDQCGCSPEIAQVCYRGAFEPLEVDSSTWADGWVIHGSTELGYDTLNLAPFAFRDSTNNVAGETWSPDSTYLLFGRVACLGGVLTIDPGTVVLGDVNTTGYLVIERGSRIVAVGTADEPIVMTTNAIPPSPGSWGGLVLHGRAVANCADCFGGESCISEGAAGDFCGDDDCDDSGSLRYVRVQYSGKEISLNNELNSFTMNAVGCGTDISYLQAHRGSDDLFEWFGGKVNCSYLYGTGGGDDGLDWQMGFRGSVHHALIQRYPDQGERGIEADNNEDDYDAPCRSNPLIANVTLVGVGDGAEGIVLRRGTDSQIFNSIILRWDYALRTQNKKTCDRGVHPQPATFCGPFQVAAPDASTRNRFELRTLGNPAVGNVAFAFTLPAAGSATLQVYDILGRLVGTVVNGPVAAGDHTVSWSPARDLASGTYFYRFTGAGAAAPVTGRLTLIQ